MKKVLIFVITALFLLPSFAFADGGMMPPHNRWIYETGQKGVIVYQNKTESLVLQTSFQGDAEDFAYIVPTPSKPEVSKISDDIFRNLEELTLPDINFEPMPMADFGAAETKSSVNIIEEKKVGIFDVTVLSASDADSLYNWLKENNFTYPISKKHILDDYIQNDWYFTTAKITPEAISTDTEDKLHRGELTPLMFVFQTENIVFPLKISSVFDENKIPDIVAFSEPVPTDDPDRPVGSDIAPAPPIPYGTEIPITLYIFSDHKKEIPNFYIDYANWIKDKDIEKLAKDDNGNYWVDVKGKMYLTKLSAYVNYSDMTSDLFPDDAKDNKTVGVPSWWERNATFLVLIVILMIILFYVLSFIQFLSDNKKSLVFLWVMQILIFALIGIPVILMYLLGIANNFYFWSTGYNNFHMILLFSIFVLNLPFSMIVILIAQKLVQKK